MSGELALRCLLEQCELATARWHLPLSWATLRALALVCRDTHAHVWACWHTYGYGLWLHRERIRACVWRTLVCCEERRYRLPCADAGTLRPIRDPEACGHDHGLPREVAEMCRWRITRAHVDANGVWTHADVSMHTSVDWILVFMQTNAPVVIHARDGVRSDSWIVRPRACRSRHGAYCAELSLWDAPTAGIFAWELRVEGTAVPTAVFTRVCGIRARAVRCIYKRVCRCATCMHRSEYAGVTGHLIQRHMIVRETLMAMRHGWISLCGENHGCKPVMFESRAVAARLLAGEWNKNVLGVLDKLNNDYTTAKVLLLQHRKSPCMCPLCIHMCVLRVVDIGSPTLLAARVLMRKC